MRQLGPKRLQKRLSSAKRISVVHTKDRFDIILANPPFGGSERKEIKETFPIKTGDLFRLR